MRTEGDASHHGAVQERGQPVYAAGSQAVEGGLLAGAVGGLLGLGIGYASQFAFNITVTRLLPVDQAGRLFQDLAIMALLGLLTRFGMERLAMREIGRYAGPQGSPAHVRKLLFASVAVPFCLAALVVALLSWLGNPLWRTVFDAGMDVVDRTVLVATPFVSACFVLSCVARGLRATFNAGLIQLAGIYGGTSIVAILLAMVGGGLDAAGLAQVFAFVSCVCFLGGLVWVVRHRSLGKCNVSQDNSTIAWSGLGFFYVLTLLSFGLSGADVLCVSVLLDAEATAVYAVAAKTAFALNIGLAGVNSILFASAARSHHAGDRDALIRAVRRTATWSAAVALSLAMLLGLGSNFFLGLYGLEYVKAERLFHLLLLANVVNASMGGVSVVLQMSGLEKAAVRVLGASLAGMLALYALLVPRLGLIGGGLATAFMLIASPMAMAWVIRLRLGFWPIPDRAAKVVAWCLLLAVGLALKPTGSGQQVVWLTIAALASTAVMVSVTGFRSLADMRRAWKGSA